MNTQFTTKSQEALSAAAMNASTAGNPQIEPAHVLKALMDQRESVAVAVLKAANVDPDAVSTQASSQIAALPKVSGTSVAEAQLSRAGLAMIAAAQTQAQQNQDQFVSTEHLLLGLAADNGDTGTSLREAGATVEALTSAMKSVRGDTKSPRRTQRARFRPWNNTAQTSPMLRLLAHWTRSSGATPKCAVSFRCCHVGPKTIRC